MGKGSGGGGGGCSCGLFACCCRLKGKADQFADEQKVINQTYRPNRWPTDIPCVLLFAVFWMGMVIIAVFAVERGDPRSLILPTDRMNNFCGEMNVEASTNIVRNLTTKPYLWYPFSINIANPTKSLLFDALDMGICVEKCPSKSALSISLTNFSGLAEFATSAIVCEYDYQGVSAAEKARRVSNETGGCYINWLPTTEFQRRCIPTLSEATNLDAVTKKLMQAVFYAGNAIKRGLYEVQATWPILAFLIVIMIVICFIFLCLVQTFIKFLVYTVLYILFFFLGTAAAYCGWIGYRKFLEGDSLGDDDLKKWSYVYFVVCGVLGLAELIYLVLMIFLMNRIGIAMEIISIAARPIRKVPWLCLVPVFTFAAAIGVTAYWVIIAGYIQSAKTEIVITGSEFSDLAEMVNLNLTTNNESALVIGADTITTTCQYYHIFGYFWTLAFVMAIGYCVVAGVVSNWYFSSPGMADKKVGLFPVVRSFGRVIIFHVGSVLFGALLVAIVQFLRFLARQLEKQMKRSGSPTNKITVCLFKVLQIVLCIAEKIIRFINKNAYILMMIHGKCFMSSSVRAIILILTNILQIGVVNFIGDAMLFLAQVGLTVGGTVICYFLIDLANDVQWMNWMIYMAPASTATGLHVVEYAVVPTLAGAVIAYIISGLFVNLYKTAIDTVLICYCEDKKCNDGTPAKPYYMPPALQTKLGCCNEPSVGGGGGDAKKV